MDKAEGSKCFFCELPEERVLAKSDNFTVAICLGPLVEGHIIVIGHQHRSGLIDFESIARQELVDIKQSLKTLLSETYGACLFFEHGHHGHSKEERLHSHAHLHAVPVDTDLYPEISERYQEVLGADYSSDIDLPDEYLFYEGPKRAPVFFPLSEEPERQFIRKMVSSRLGREAESGDWERFPNFEAMDATRERLSEACRHISKTIRR